MSNNRILGNLATYIDSASGGGAITKAGNDFFIKAMTDSDVGGTPATGFAGTDSASVKGLITTADIVRKGKKAKDAPGLKNVFQGNVSKLNPSVTATYNIGDSSNPIDEIILDSSATIFFGDISLTSVLRSGTSTIAVAAVVASPVAGSAETSFLLKTDSTQTDAQVDASTNAFAITQSGDVKSTAFTPYHPKGYSVYLDGTGDYITTSSNIHNGIGTGDFTAEAWVYLDETIGSNRGIFGSGSSDTADEFTLLLLTDGSLYFDYGGSADYVQTGAVFTAKRWHHIALTRSGTSFNIWLNGTSVASTTLSASIGGTSNFAVGWGRGIVWKGYISDARVVVGTAVYTAAFTPPTERLTAVTNTKLLTCHLPYIADGSSDNLSITVAGNTHTQQFSPYDHVAYSPSDHRGSVYFDGTSDYLTVSSSGSTIGGLSSFTVEGWYWPDPSSENSTYDAVYSCAGGLSTGYQTAGRLYNYNGDAGFYWNSVDQAWSYNGDWVAGAWNHFAVTHDGTTTKVYINGREVISTTSPSFSGTTDIQVSEPDYPAYGYISDFRISDSVIYTAAFTPPTEPLTAISGTQLLTCNNKNSIYDTAGGNVLTVVGNTTTSTSTVNYSSSSVYFDGAGDYIKLDGSFSDFFDNPFTIEFFVNLTSASSSSVISLGDGSGVDGLYLLHGGYGCYVGTNGTWDIISGSVTGMTTGTWHHFAFTWDGSDYRIFVDGALELSATSSAKIGPGGGYTLAIGATYTGVQPTNGYVEDVRFTKGLARYTANFTPPTAALEG